MSGRTHDVQDPTDHAANLRSNDLHQGVRMDERPDGVSGTQERQARSIRRHRINWTAEMLERLVVTSWKRPIESIELRSERVAATNASFGRKSLMWNSYVDSLIPYPSRVAPPNEDTLERMERAQRLALQSRTAWCPKRALSAMGVYHGIKGAPRCPRASAMAHGAWSHILKEPRGPTPARRDQAELWRKTVQHASGLLSTVGDSQRMITPEPHSNRHAS